MTSLADSKSRRNFNSEAAKESSSRCAARRFFAVYYLDHRRQGHWLHLEGASIYFPGRIASSRASGIGRLDFTASVKRPPLLPKFSISSQLDHTIGFVASISLPADR